MGVGGNICDALRIGRTVHDELIIVNIDVRGCVYVQNGRREPAITIHASLTQLVVVLIAAGVMILMRILLCANHLICDAIRGIHLVGGVPRATIVHQDASP